MVLQLQAHPAEQSAWMQHLERHPGFGRDYLLALSMFLLTPSIRSSLDFLLAVYVGRFCCGGFYLISSVLRLLEDFVWAATLFRLETFCLERLMGMLNIPQPAESLYPFGGIQ